MTNDDAKEFARLMVAAGEMYGREVSRELMRMMFDALADLPIQDVKRGIKAHVNSPDGGQFFPKPADIRRQLVGTAKEQAAQVEDRGSVAWAAIQYQIRRVGSYGTLKLEDRQALAAVKAMGGWSDLCHTQADKMEWKRKEFLRLYETFERTPLDMLPASMPGRIELSQQRAEGPQALDRLFTGIAARAQGGTNGKAE